MQADVVRRCIAQPMLAALFAACLAVAGPAAPKARADGGLGSLSPCNLPGGKLVCDTADKGTKWLYDKSGADTVVDTASGAIDFATDPLGYLEQKLRAGTQGIFSAFGEELTGKKPPSPKHGKGN
ncbi:hypothetical protein ACFQ9Z_33520 [Streptomyces sp. NPDC056580]|uniref:hypothetical protein n=1 Tax=Streptomyces sp. NPDC056580 TaxID=3345872 RepID=UPI0036881338